MIDYRDLLKKYMKHVGEAEGTFFLSFSGTLTQFELDELVTIGVEVDTEWGYSSNESKS